MKKIMFNDKYGLTQAVLSGHKTMTRKIITNKHCIGCLKSRVTNDFAIKHFSRYQVGEVIAIAQSYRNIVISGDGLGFSMTCKAWRNKMYVKAKYMPHHIRINNIRIERLQDISEDNCLREGIIKHHFEKYDEYGYGFHGLPMSKYLCVPRDAFLTLIDKVAGKGTWKNNPYVFVYEFELVD